MEISKFYDDNNGVYYDIADAEARQDISDLKSQIATIEDELLGVDALIGNGVIE